MSATGQSPVALPGDRSASPERRTPAEDAAYHRREAIRLRARAGWTTNPARIASLLARVDMHLHSAMWADLGAPQFVIDNPPAMFAGWPAPDLVE